MPKQTGVRWFFRTLLSVLAVFGLSMGTVLAIAISHAYQAAGEIKDGSLVSLDARRADFVQPANTSNHDRLVGVKVSDEEALLAVDQEESKVQVAVTGKALVLVSTLNGNIKVGDKIGASPFNGVGMKADTGSPVIGTTQSDFNGRSKEAVSQEVTSQGGQKTRVQVGYIRLNIAVGVAGSQAENEGGLKGFGRDLTGHEVSTPRLVLSLVIAAAAIIALITLVYGAIYGGIISIGRNPLAKFAVLRTLTSVLAMAGLIALTAATAVFLLLR